MPSESAATGIATATAVCAAAVPLAQLQSRMAAALLAADPAQQALAEELFAGVLPGAVGLRVHRNTVLGALSHALRHSFVSVDRLVGEDFFDRMALDYARFRPPHAPQLDVYGNDFPEFIAGYRGTESLPYLADLARFDWQIDELARTRSDGGDGEPPPPGAPLPPGASLLLEEGGARLRFLPSLRLHRTRFPVDRLRAAILAEDAAALGAIGLEPAAQAYALWRATEGVKVQALSPPAAAFLAAALADGDGPAALAAAVAAIEAVAAAEVGDGAEGAPGASALVDMLTREIFAASFVQIETIAPLAANQPAATHENPEGTR